MLTSFLVLTIEHYNGPEDLICLKYNTIMLQVFYQYEIVNYCVCTENYNEDL